MTSFLSAYHDSADSLSRWRRDQRGVRRVISRDARGVDRGTDLDLFDLIVGTSTGGIVALGLGLDLSAREILAFYVNRGAQVFRGSRFLRAVRWLGAAKYDPRPLRASLQDIFGDRKLGESRNRLVIPALNLETGEVYVYKTAHHSRFERDYRERAVDVALATAAAPTYFPAHRSAAGLPLIDGGMWHNPTGVAVVEAIGVLDWPRDSLRVLSLGCTAEPLSVALGRHWSLGAAYWALKAADVFLAGQSSAALDTAKLLVGEANLVRICPQVAPGRFGLDTVKEIDSFKGLGNSEARNALPRLRPMFFQSVADPFEPLYRVTE